MKFQSAKLQKMNAKEKLNYAFFEIFFPFFSFLNFL